MAKNNALKVCALRIPVGLMVMGLLLAGVANAKTITVGHSGGADHANIQDAIDNASDWDTILVDNGTYFETISITKNNFTIIGNERNSTIIKGNWSVDRVVDVRASNVHFSGFTVANSNWEGTGLYLDNTTNFTFINNILRDNYYNMQIINSNFNLIDSNNISINEFLYSSYYYYEQYINYVSSSNNTFSRNTGQSSISLTNSSNNKYINNSLSNIVVYGYSVSNKFEDNKLKDISLNTYSSSPYSNENIIRNNEAQGINIYNTNQNIIEGNNISSLYISSSDNNTINNNTILQYYGYCLFLYNSSKNTIHGNNITSGRYYFGLSINSNSNNNTISNNLIQGAQGNSIYIIWSNSNKLYFNTFNSAKNAFSYNGINSWDGAGKGNYWSDYRGQDNNSDGIGDTPYLNIETNADAKDNYPLMVSPCNCTLLPVQTPDQEPDLVDGGAIVSIPEVIAANNSNVSCSIMVENVTNLGAATVKISYDPTIVNVLSISARDIGGSTDIGGGWTYNIKNSIGEAIISAYSNTGRSGNVTYANLLLRAVGTINATSPLNLSVSTLSNENGAHIPFNIRNGNFTILALMKGDINGDGAVNIVDALFIAQYTVGTRTLTSTQLAAADVNGDGQVTIVDALFIAQYTVGLRQL